MKHVQVERLPLGFNPRRLSALEVGRASRTFGFSGISNRKTLIAFGQAASKG